MAQTYECVVLMDPDLSDEDIQKYLDQFTQVVNNAGGEVSHVKTWGRRRLTYPIKNQREAHYAILYFRLEDNAPVAAEFERLVRVQDELLREMTVKVPELNVTDAPPELDDSDWRPMRGRPTPVRGPGAPPRASAAVSAGDFEKPAPSSSPSSSSQSDSAEASNQSESSGDESAKSESSDDEPKSEAPSESTPS